MSSWQRPVVTLDSLSTWCEARFEAPVTDVIFESGYSSAVFGLVLNDDRRVVAKIRPWHTRRQACWEVHRYMWARGFPCPEPLGPPECLSGWAVSFEAYLPGGDRLGRGPEAAHALGRVLADLVHSAPASNAVPKLDPELGFLRWNEPGDAWPPATDVESDLNELREPVWIERFAALARTQLRGSELPTVLGHGDWWSDNIRWENGKLLAVDDWDSIVSLSEPAIAGVAAALFADGQSTIEESATFLDAYIAASGRRWTQREYQMAWAAGLWARLFDARKASLQGIFDFADTLKLGAEERLERAGLRLL